MTRAFGSTRSGTGAPVLQNTKFNLRAGSMAGSAAVGQAWLHGIEYETTPENVRTVIEKLASLRAILVES
jgi:hypothetical protein